MLHISYWFHCPRKWDRKVSVSSQRKTRFFVTAEDCRHAVGVLVALLGGVAVSVSVFAVTDLLFCSCFLCCRGCFFY